MQAATSFNEPIDISKNLANSKSDFLEEPSAIFNMIDKDALLIWSLNE